MRNGLLMVVAGFCICFSTQAQTQVQRKKTVLVKAVDVPENVSNTFKTLYTAAADNQWTKNYSGNYVASFRNTDSLRQTVEFSRTGAMIKSRVDYKPEVLPQNISAAVAAQYPNNKVTEAARLQLPGVAPYYKVRVLNTDNTSKELLVSEEGTITE